MFCGGYTHDFLTAASLGQLQGGILDRCDLCLRSGDVKITQFPIPLRQKSLELSVFFNRYVFDIYYIYYIIRYYIYIYLESHNPIFFGQTALTIFFGHYGFDRLEPLV